jgi:hypothetical protein
VNFYVTDQLMIRYSLFITCFKKCEYDGAVHQLFIDLKIQLGGILYTCMPVTANTNTYL